MQNSLFVSFNFSFTDNKYKVKQKVVMQPHKAGDRTLTDRRDETSSKKLWTDAACEELHHQIAEWCGWLWHAIPWFNPTPNVEKCGEIYTITLWSTQIKWINHPFTEKEPHVNSQEKIIKWRGTQRHKLLSTTASERRIDGTAKLTSYFQTKQKCPQTLQVDLLQTDRMKIQSQISGCWDQDKQLKGLFGRNYI